MTLEQKRQRMAELKAKAGAKTSRYETPPNRYEGTSLPTEKVGPKVDGAQAVAIAGMSGLTLDHDDEIVGAEGAAAEKINQYLRKAGLQDPEPRVSDELHQPPVRKNGKMYVEGQLLRDSGPMPDKDFGEMYTEERDKARELKAEAQKQHPGKFATVQIASSLAVPGPKIAKGFKGSGFLGRAKEFAKVGAPVGAAAGSGSSTADLTKGEFGPYLKDVATMGVFGAGTSALVGPTGEKAFGKLADYLRGFAKKKALHAAGLRGAIGNTLQKENIKTAEQAADEIGGPALDHDLIPFFGSKDAVNKRAGELRKKMGPAVDSYFEQGDALASPEMKTEMFNDALVAGQGVYDDLDDLAIKHTDKADEILDSWATSRDRGGGFLDTRKMNSTANKVTPHDKSKQVPVKEEIFGDVKRAMRGSALKSLENVLPEGDIEGLRAVNKAYQLSKRVEKLSSNAGTRETANRGQGLLDTLDAQNVAENIPGPGGFLASKVYPHVAGVFTQRGPAALAVGSNKMSKVLAKLQDPAAKASPGAARIAAMLAAKLQTDPESALAMYQALIGEDPEFQKAAAAQ